MPKFSFRELFTSLEPKKRNILYLLIALVLSTLIVLIYLNNLTNRMLRKDEIVNINEFEDSLPVVKDVSYEGKVVFVDSRLYPGQNVNYILLDSDGNQLFLLKSRDEKLSVVEGLYVTISGRIEDSLSKNDKILIVDRVTVKK